MRSGSSQFKRLNLPGPIVADIGTNYDVATGITYEFILNTPNDGPVFRSSALIGSRGTGSGVNAGIKWEQYSSGGELNEIGVTTFGVKDYFTGIPNIYDVDVSVAFVLLGDNIEVFFDGVSQGDIALDAGQGFAMTGEVGIGQAFDPGGNFDVFQGTIYAVSTYNTALTPAQLIANMAAFATVDPFENGDFNHDFSIDLDDYAILKTNFGTGSSNGEGDIDFDGDVDLEDYSEFALAYEDANGSSLASAIPEPTSMLLMGLGVVAMLKRSK